MMDMAVAASSAVQIVQKIGSSNTQFRPEKANINPDGRWLFLTRRRNAPLSLPTIRFKRAFLVRAAKPGREEQTSNEDGPGNSTLLSQEDLSYLTKLGAGSVAGAAAIKYGSVVFPEITRPNLVEALSIISFPVVVAVLLLIWQSRSE